MDANSKNRSRNPSNKTPSVPPASLSAAFCTQVFRHTDATHAARAFAHALAQPVILWEWNEALDPSPPTEPIAASAAELSDGLIRLLFGEGTHTGRSWVHRSVTWCSDAQGGIQGLDVRELDFSAHAHLFSACA